MKNTDFYAYCREQRKTEPDPHKKVVLTEVDNFLFECGTTKLGVKQFVECLMREPKNTAKVAAYRWLLGVFDGPSEPAVDDATVVRFISWYVATSTIMKKG